MKSTLRQIIKAASSMEDGLGKRPTGEDFNELKRLMAKLVAEWRPDQFEMELKKDALQGFKTAQNIKRREEVAKQSARAKAVLLGIINKED